ncbi:ROK family protein [Thalassotalea sp. PLHSN55]|uniref:ROK family protein n=1 Tax=Thalassotalea sp. PLHSN55 TaxID=3435888 RepID=UPI003F85DB3F
MSANSKNTSVTYGLDIGGTKIEIGLFDHQFELMDSWRVSTPTHDYNEFLQAIADLIFEADKRTGQQGSIGIGMPGILDKNALVKSANVHCATGKPIVTDLEMLLGRSVAVANDCRLFALSESCGGAGDKHPIVYGAIIGTGAGGGLCLHNKLYQSSNNIAGEYGHLPASGHLLAKYNLPVRECGCGLTGCSEAYIAGPGLGWLYNHFGSGTFSTIQFVCDLRDKNPIALKTFACYMEFLGSAFSTLVLSYDPDVIVVGGGLSKIEEIIDALPNAINAHLFDGVESPVISSAVFGDSSGVRGAAILGRQHADNR